MKTQNTLAAIVVIGLTVFLYELAQFFAKIQSWEVIWNPPSVSQMLMAVVFALVAVGAAMGMDISKWLTGMGITLGLTKPPE